MKSYEPHDRLTRIGKRLLDAVEDDPEYQDGDKFIIMSSGEERTGISAHGYEDNETVGIFEDLFWYLYVVAKANGMDLQFMPLESRGQG